MEHAARRTLVGPLDDTVPVAHRPLMFWFFIACWTVIHLQFEYRFWLGDSSDIFRKYAALTPEGQLEAAKHIYYTKATWMFAFVWLQIAGLRLTSAMSWAFLFYALQLLYFFPITLYAMLNLGLALACIAEDIRLRRAGVWS